MKKLSDFDTAEATSKNVEAVKDNPPRYPRYVFLLNEIERFRNKLFDLKYARD